MRRWRVKDVMTTPVVSVSESASYKDIIDALVDHTISAVPVVDPAGRVIGVVSEADLLCRMEFAGSTGGRHLLERKRRRSARAKAQGDSAAELMSAPAVVIDPRATLTVAARLMDAEEVKRLPVVDHKGELVGIVSRRDLLRVYLREDAAIHDEIVERVLVGTLWMDRERLVVTVERGVVTLAGTVDRKSTIPLLVSLVESVAGVIAVVSHLTYHFADDRVATDY